MHLYVHGDPFVWQPERLAPISHCSLWGPSASVSQCGRVVMRMLWLAMGYDTMGVVAWLMVMPAKGWAMDTATGATETATGAMETGGAMPCAMVWARAADSGVISGLRWGGGAEGGAALEGGAVGAPVGATRSCWVTGRGCRPALLKVVCVWAMLWL